MGGGGGCMHCCIQGCVSYRNRAKYLRLSRHDTKAFVHMSDRSHRPQQLSMITVRDSHDALMVPSEEQCLMLSCNAFAKTEFSSPQGKKLDLKLEQNALYGERREPENPWKAREKMSLCLKRTDVFWANPLAAGGHSDPSQVIERN